MGIQVQALSKRYGRTWAVRDLSFEVRPGKVTGFLGPNGSGKSTTMRSIVGLDRPTSGRALIDGTRYAQLPAPLRAVGTMLDAKSAHRSRRAVDHLRTVAATHGFPRTRVDEVIGLTGLESVARRKAGQFSLGMGQRLGIAVALLGDPHTLILDEPVNGLDPEGVAWLRGLLGSLAAEGRTVFLSSHLLSELALVAEHVVVIGRGELIADAPLVALTTDTGRTLEEAYTELTRDAVEYRAGDADGARS
jgi:ABC-2 type transport system ATP-binding protein